MSDMAPILLYHAFKAMTSFVDLLSMNACDSCCQALTIVCLRGRLECMVQQNGAHIEHLFK